MVDTLHHKLVKTCRTYDTEGTLSVDIKKKESLKILTVPMKECRLLENYPTILQMYEIPSLMWVGEKATDINNFENH